MSPENPPPATTAWNDRPTVAEVARWHAGATRAHSALGDERSVVYHDLDRQERRFVELAAAFPAGALHAVAVKANPIVALLRRLVERGAGLETASIEEVHVALAAGCPPERIVFDSPAKTVDELRFALERGMTVNVDNHDELRAALRIERHPAARLGLRVNPGAGDGAIAATSVGGAGSRFGFGLDELTEHVLPDLPSDARIDGLHVHVGSQGCELPQLVGAVRVADELRGMLDERFGRPLGYVDVGGGLPTDYLGSAAAPTIHDYASALAQAVPGLWRDTQIVTEFGRSLLAGCGVAVSDVEYVKTTGDGRRIAVIHLGADFLLRAAYAPENWPYRFSVIDATDGAVTAWDVAGPLCFAGDVIGRDIPLPDVSPGDEVVIHDVGAYSISMWSRHCSRGMPAVIGVEPDGSFSTLLAPERPHDIAEFWSRGAEPGVGWADAQDG